MNKIGKAVVTLKMIAEAAGVHLSTVSLALRNDPRLPVPTRARIRAMADRLGYRPNPLIAALMARVRRSNVNGAGLLGYLHTVPRGTPRLQGHVHHNYIAGARRRAEELGYRLDEFFLTPELSFRRLRQMLLARHVTGLVIEHTPTPLVANRVFEMDLKEFATATLGTPLAQPQLHYVANDQYMRAIVAARELLALGYRRIGLIIEGHFDCAMAHRCSAGYLALQEYLNVIEVLPILRADRGQVSGFDEWFARHRPHAIMSSHEPMLQVVRAVGLRVPDDVGWALLDWHPEFAPAAGVCGNSDLVGAGAVELVVSQIHRGETGAPACAMNHFVAGRWQPGETVRRVGTGLDLDAEFFSDLLPA